MNPKSIVYFVGAGLSKALEKPGKPIPLMYDFVSVMADYALDDEIILTTLAELVNAGIFAWPSPESSELAKRVAGRNCDRRAATLARFRDSMKRRPAESVEDLLLRAASEAQRPPSSGGEAMRISACAESPDRFRYAISRLFGRWIGWGVEWRPLETFLSHQFASHPLDGCEHIFISFNYDLLLDRGIQRVTRDDHPPGQAHWHPSTGYGFEISWQLGGLEVQPAPTVSGGVVTAGTAEHTDAHRLPLVPSGNILLLKPHGSLNWIACHDEKHKGFDPNKPLFLARKDPTNGDVDYWHPRSQECVNIIYRGPAGSGEFCAAHGSIFLIPPTPPAKETRPAFLTKVREVEKTAIREADEVFVIGWSMHVTDQDQICTIRCCVAERDKALDSVTVINRGEKPEYFDRIADTFGVTRSALRTFNNGFSDYVEHCTS